MRFLLRGGAGPGRRRGRAADEPWLIAATRALAGLLPTASLRAVEGAQHNVEAEVLAPELRQFALAGQATGH